MRFLLICAIILSLGGHIQSATAQDPTADKPKYWEAVLPSGSTAERWHSSGHAACLASYHSYDANDGLKPNRFYPTDISYGCLWDKGSAGYWGTAGNAYLRCPTGTLPTGDKNECSKPMPMNDCSAGNPIKIGSGVKYQKETDFSVGRGRLKFERFYSSNAFDFDSPLGQQWSSNFHPRVRSNFRFTGGGQFELVLDTGETLKMSRYRDEDWTFAGIKDRPWKKAFAYGRNENDKTRVDYKLELTDTAELTLTHPDGMQQVFGHETWRYGAENPFLKKITYADGYEITLNRDAAGVLLSATDTDGYTISFGHDDRNLLTSVTAPDGSVYAYEYFALPGAIDATTITSGTVQSTWRFYSLMSAVIYPDNTASNSQDNPKKQYKYEHAKFLEALTSVIDERGITVSTWDYAYFTDYGWRATSSSGPNGHKLTQIEVVTPKQQYRVTNALGKESLFNYAQAGAIPRLTSVDGVASANCASSTQSIGRDNDGFPTTVTGAEGQQETRIYDTATGFPSSITHGAGTNDAVTVNFAWDTVLRKPTQITYPGLTTAITYGTNELPSQVTHADTTSHTLPYPTNGQQRTWNYAWTGEGLLQSIDGPLAGSGDTVSFTYDTNGNLASVTNELGHVTTINSVDGMGRPTQITDPNGVVTSMTYTPRGWVDQITQSSGGNSRVTDLAYDLAGNLTRIDFPNGGWLTYTYNDSSWLTKVTSSAGDEIAYQHNLLGNVTRADFQTAGAASIAWFTMQYDELGRLTQRLGGAGDALTYAYDRSDRRTTVTDGTGRPWLTGFDALNRVVSETDPELHSIGMDWSATDDLTSFTDGRNFSTTFVRNGFGDVVREVSPDRGTTDYWYDNAGRVTRILDAEGDDTQFSYDNAGRVLTETYPNQAALNVAYTYDSVSGGNSGTGRLTGVSGAESGHTFAYNGYGELTSKVSTVGSQSYTTTQAFNSSGQLSILTLPSGRAVDFGYDTNNRVTSITTTSSGGGATQTVVSNVTYAPFGSMTGYSFGNGASATFGLDSSFRLSSLNVSGSGSTLVNKTYQYDANNRVTSIADSLNGANSTTYTYKPDGRLASAVGPWGDFAWTYDAVGNRMTDSRYQASALIKDDVYNYSSSSNRLLSVDNNNGGVNRMISYTADGNIDTDIQTAAPSRDYEYDDDGRLGSISANGSVVATYDYDAFEHRVRRIEGGVERHFVFSAGGMLLGEYDGATGGVVTEYIWLNDRLVGSVDGAGVLSYVQTGHLGQPLLVMDGAGAATWTGETTPFGVFVGTTGTGSDPELRFPGQWNEAGSGLLHNWHRDYDPTLGRYIEADPLGIAAGQSLYGYARQEPTNLIDPDGLRFGAMGAAGLMTALANMLDGYVSNLECQLAMRGGGPLGSLDHKAAAGAGLQRGIDYYNDPLSIAFGPLGKAFGKGGKGFGSGGSPFNPRRRPPDGSPGPERPHNAWHYTFQKHSQSIRENGLRPGSYATPNSNLSGLQAQIDLALPPNRGIVDTRLTIDIEGLRNAGIPVVGPRAVKRDFSMPGGGEEYFFPQGVPSEFIK